MRRRRVGLVLAGIASAGWLFVAAAFFLAEPGGGVLLGAGLVYVLAVPLSVVSSGLLLSATRDEARPEGPGSPWVRRARWPAVATAALSIVCLVAVFVLGASGGLPPVLVSRLLAVGIGAFLLSSALFALPAPSRARR